MSVHRARATLGSLMVALCFAAAPLSTAHAQSSAGTGTTTGAATAGTSQPVGYSQTNTDNDRGNGGSKAGWLGLLGLLGLLGMRKRNTEVHHTTTTTAGYDATGTRRP